MEIGITGGEEDVSAHLALSEHASRPYILLTTGA